MSIDYATLEARVLAASAPIRNALEAILKPVDPRWEASIITAYQDSARNQLKGWLAYLAAEEPKDRHDRRSQPHYVRYEKRESELTAPWGHAACRAAATARRYSADIKAATRDGERQYASIRESFLARLTAKIAYILQGKHADVTGIIELNRMIEGTLTVKVEGMAATFEMRVKVMQNFRYNENSANRHLTVYAQYPVTFTDARVNGLKPSPLSEEMLAHVISGLPLDYKERATRAQIDARKALNAEKARLDRIREGYSRLVDDYRWIEDYEATIKREPGTTTSQGRAERLPEMRREVADLCQRYGITDPGSKKAALAERKKIIEQLKALRAKKEG